jgi:hypothetical protein
MNSLQRKGLVALAVLSVAAFAVMFTTMAHAAQIHVNQSGDPDPDTGTPCSGTGSGQVGDCIAGSGDQPGGQSTAGDNVPEPVGSEDYGGD